MKSSRKSEPGDTDGSRLDGTSRDSLKLLIRIVHRCGGSPEAIEHAVHEEVLALRKERSRSTNKRIERDLPSAHEVMTRWYRDPPYVDDKGQPRPLTPSGRASSFTTLVRSVDRKLNAAEAARYLRRAGNIRYHRGKYWPVSPVVILRGIPGPRDFRVLGVANAMLSNAEHNLIPADEDPTGWLERTAENESVPTRLLPDYLTFLGTTATALILEVDAWLHNAAGDAKPGEPTVDVTFGVYHSERGPRTDAPPEHPDDQPVRRSRRAHSVRPK